MTEETQANLSQEPSKSFREIAEQRLQQESQPDQPAIAEDTSPGGEVYEDEEPHRETAGMEAEESDDQPEADIEAEASEETEPESEWDLREREWSEKVDKAEEARHNMERDYRRKTHKLAESVRGVDAKLKEVEQTAEYFANQARAELGQFDSVNWQQLQSDPQQYQQAQQAWMQAQQRANARTHELQQIQERAKKMHAEMQQSIADHSRGVLQHQIPNWGGEVYSKLREFAEQEYDYSSEQFDQMVDWRPMKMIYDAYQARQVKQDAAKTVTKIGRKRGRKAPARTADGQPRNALGQFQKAQQEAYSNPGDRNLVRNAFQERLKRERGRR